MSYGQVERVSDTSTENETTKDLHLCAQGPKIIIEKILSFKKISPKTSFSHLSCSFDNPAEVFLPGVGKFLAHSPRITEKNVFFQTKVFFPQSFPMAT